MQIEKHTQRVIAPNYTNHGSEMMSISSVTADDIWFGKSLYLFDGIDDHGAGRSTVKFQGACVLVIGDLGQTESQAEVYNLERPVADDRQPFNVFWLARLLSDASYVDDAQDRPDVYTK